MQISCARRVYGWAAAGLCWERFSIFLLSGIAILLPLAGAYPKSALKSAPKTPLLGAGSNLRDFSILSFNLQNLFDAQHEFGKEDWSFLPRSFKRSEPGILEFCARLKTGKWRNECFFQDWTVKVLESKLNAIVSALAAKKLGARPDILVFQEVENLAVLKALQRRLPGYPYLAHREGPDPRGIEVAILSRWPGKSFFHSPYPGAREILEFRFDLPKTGGGPAVLFALHLPSQAQGPRKRVLYLKLLNRLAAAIPESYLKLAAGDFNISNQEEKRWGIIQTYLRPTWLIPHLDLCSGCLGSFWDSRKREWNKFDLVLVGRGGTLRNYLLEARVHSFSQYPQPFSPTTAQGVSDHFPVSLTLKERGKAR